MSGAGLLRKSWLAFKVNLVNLVPGTIISCRQVFLCYVINDLDNAEARAAGELVLHVLSLLKTPNRKECHDTSKGEKSFR